MRSAVSVLPLLVALSAAVSAGCASSPAPAANPFAEPGSQQIRIEVLNNNFNDATIWAVWSGSRRRLGTVTGKTTETFRLAWTLSQDLQIEINLLAGERCTTRSLPVDPGDSLQLTIDVVLRQSALCR